MQKQQWPCFLFKQRHSWPWSTGYSTEVTDYVLDEGVLSCAVLALVELKNKRKREKESEHLENKKKCPENTVTWNTHTLAGIPVHGLHRSSKCTEANKNK